MQFLTADDLKCMMISASKQIIDNSSSLNALNVFPVPDHDTGTNLSMTFSAVSDALETFKGNSMHDLSLCIEQSILRSSQGNSGMVMCAFWCAFFQTIHTKNKVKITDIAASFQDAHDRATACIEKPVPGKILDITALIAKCMKSQMSENIHDNFFALSQEIAQYMKKKSSSLDAGALGLALMIDGFCLSFKDNQSYESIIAHLKLPSTFSNHHIHISKNKYEIVALIQNSILKNDEIKEMIKEYGDSIDIVELENKIKLHIHTDMYDVLKEAIHTLGTVTFFQIVNMETEETIEKWYE